MPSSFFSLWSAAALGRLGGRDTVPKLLEALRGGADRFVEHALVYALIEIGDRAATLAGLTDASPAVNRGALIALDQMERGAALEPENAAAWDRLGRARETNLENLDPAGAVADFQKAVAHVPLSATYWMDLANGYEAIGNVPLAREAFTRARAAYPASAVVAWGYGNFLLRQNDYDAGFAQIKQALQADSKLVTLAVSRVWHLNQDAGLLLNQVLPANQDAYFQAIDFMQENRQPAAALAIWQRLLSLGKPFELRRSFAYTVVAPDESAVLGCVYLYPSETHDVRVKLWVTGGAFAEGLDPVLEAAVREWVTSSWPFEQVTFAERDR